MQPMALLLAGRRMRTRGVAGQRNRRSGAPLPSRNHDEKRQDGYKYCHYFLFRSAYCMGLDDGLHAVCSLINWRIERDDALGTLFFTFVLLNLGCLARSQGCF